MLAFLVGLLVCVGPLLRAGWDLWAQTILFTSVVAGCGLYVAARLIHGYLPLPSFRLLAWTAVLSFLAAAAALAGPLPAYAAPSWRWLVLGLWIFPALTVVSKDGRVYIDEGLRACSWILVLLAFYQRFREGHGQPLTVFPNANVFAGALIMLLPLAWQKKDWLLVVGLAACLVWCRSVGAWLGLSAALFLARRQAGVSAAYGGMALGLVCLAVLYGKLESAEILDRWHWWAAAARMSRDNPFLGLGPGTFAYAMTAYEDAGRRLGSVYAHQYFLETAAECGLPYLALWAGGLFHNLRRGGVHKRFGALAVLVQSLWDFTLSIPSNFWLFCYFTASSAPQASRGVNIAARWKLPLAAGVMALSFWTMREAVERWQAGRLATRARVMAEEGRTEEALGLLRKARSLAADPETEKLEGELERSRKNLSAAAERFERVAALNPYRASHWRILERVYLEMGQIEQARAARLRGAAFCPGLRESS